MLFKSLTGALHSLLPTLALILSGAFTASHAAVPDGGFYFRGDQTTVGENGWAAQDQYKFTLVDGTTDTYRLTLAGGITGGWKIADAGWAWYWGQGSAPANGQEADVWFNGNVNFDTRTYGPTTITFTYCANSDEKDGEDDYSIPSRVLVEAPLPSDIYFRGNQTTVDDANQWAAQDTYKFTKPSGSPTRYELTIPEGVTGPWKIATADWSWSWGAGGSQPSINTDENAWFNAGNFTTTTSGSTTITLTYVPGSDNALSSTASTLHIEAEAVTENNDFYLRGEQNGWSANDAYKFKHLGTSDGVATYSLSLDGGITGAWKIATSNWATNFGQGDNTLRFDGTAVVVNSNGANFAQQSVGTTVITFSYVKDGDSKVAIQGVEGPTGINFSGQQNSWGANGWGPGGATEYKFANVSATATERTDKLTVPAGIFGPWKIRDNNNTWVWDCGADGGTMPTAGVEYEMQRKGTNITTNTTGSTDIYVTLRLNDAKTDYSIFLSIDGTPFPYPAQMRLVSSGADASWELTTGSVADSNNGIYYFDDFVVSPKSAAENFGYVVLTTATPESADDWDTLNSGRFGPEANDTWVEDATAGMLLKDYNNAWKVAAGHYRVGVNINGQNLDSNDDNKRSITFLPIDPATRRPISLYLLCGGQDPADATESRSFTAGVYRFQDVHIPDAGKGMGTFSFSLMANSAWEMINTADRFGPKLENATVTPGVAVEMKAYAAHIGTGSCSDFQIVPGRYDLMLDFSDPANLQLTATLLALDETELELPDTLYLIGNINNYNWSNVKGVAASPADGTPGVYVFDGVTVNPSENGAGYFSFATDISEPDAGADYWSVINANDRYGASGYDITIEPGDQQYAVYRYRPPYDTPEARSWRIKAGVYKFTVDLNSNTITVAKSSTGGFSYSEEWFSKTSYEWRDKGNNLHMSYLNEPATDIEQMKYFIAAIYGNRNIPGSKHVTYAVDDDLSMEKDSGETERFKPYPDSFKLYDDDDKQIASVVRYPGIKGLETYGLPYYDEDGHPIDYTPNDHGLTAILVELDLPEGIAFPPQKVAGGRFDGQDMTLYNTLLEMDSYNTATDCQWMLEALTGAEEGKGIIKSMQLLTERTYFDSDANPGYLFNIDKPLKNFFIVLKGKPRKEGWNENINVFRDIFNCFEQISPTGGQLNGTAQMNFSAYEKLKVGAKYSVVHDCSTIVIQDHYFCMDRQEGKADGERQINLYVYIPDARMTYWEYWYPNVQKVIYPDGNNVIADGLSIDERVFGRDYWFSISSDQGYDENNSQDTEISYLTTPITTNAAAQASKATDYHYGRPIGAFTNYNPIYAPYMFSYVVKLNVDGDRVRIPVAAHSAAAARSAAAATEPDPDHYRVTLTWHSNLAEVTKAADRDVKEEFMIYPLVDGMTAAPLKAVDLYSYNLADGYDDGNTTLSIAGAGENAGALIVTTTLPEVKLDLIYNYGINEAEKTLDYIVAGKMADKDFVPVLSNEVEHRMDGKSFALAAMKYLPESKAHCDMPSKTAFYENAIRLVYPGVRENLFRKIDVNVGSKFYLMRTDVKHAEGHQMPLAEVKITEINNVPLASAPRFGKAWAHYYEWSRAESYTGSTLELHHTNAITQHYSIDQNTKKGYFLSARLTGNITDGDANENYNSADDAALIYPNTAKPKTDGSGDYFSSTGLFTYFEFVDKVTEQISAENPRERFDYYLVYDKEGNMFNADGSKGTGWEIAFNDPLNRTNTVSFVLPQSEISTEILSYTRQQIEDDASDHALPGAGTGLSVRLNNNRAIKQYALMRGNEEDIIGKVTRNTSDYYEAFTHALRNEPARSIPEFDIRKFATVSKFDADNNKDLLIPILRDDLQASDSYYGIITREDEAQVAWENSDMAGLADYVTAMTRAPALDTQTVTREFGIYPAEGIKAPKLEFANITLFDTRGVVDNDALYCEKWFKSDFIDDLWAYDFSHYNIWRRVNGGEEVCIRNHNSSLANHWVAVTKDDKVEEYEAFLTEGGSSDETPRHRHIDAFTVPGLSELRPEGFTDTEVEYTVRIYARSGRKGASPAAARRAASAFAAADDTYVLAEATATATHTAYSVPTAVENVAAPDQTRLKVWQSAPLTLRVSSSADAAIYTLTGNRIVSLFAGTTDVPLPAPGVYIVAGAGKSLKVAVK